ncbi:AraC family transcriptional regulator [Piscinibacter terrae]|uniref:AraC family transcriptional regulator n=1 Tax=Piscinibacter terrae TaxID=2496871 RepID=A0A3N7HV26_9BURK|nr:AraC family transcriptional regulator [Albitalea terrae]RQP24811.1 AraC family transcriptional regulator [Albitalea terrae]
MDWRGLDPLEIALRSALIALLLMLAGLLAKGHPRHPAARMGALLALSVSAYVLQSSPGFAVPALWWHAPILALSAGGAVAFWLFARTLFDDDFEPGAWHALAWAAMALAPVVNCFVLLPQYHASARSLGRGIDVATSLFALLAIAQTLATWRGDLVERRRRLRIFIVGAGAVYAVTAAATRLLQGDGRLGGTSGLLDVGGLLVIVAVIAARILQATSGGIFATAVQPQPVIDAEAAEPPPEPMDPAEQRLVERLDQVMAVDRFHRQEDASIGALAGQLGVPEHRLRRLINQRLGHRNFNAFLNRYRLADAKAALRDPAKSELPVLTIAMDAGFQSLGPFNRAFKADTGLTPTEFRRQGGRPMPAETAMPLAEFEIGQ